jgi:hypothetical protein
MACPEHKDVAADESILGPPDSPSAPIVDAATKNSRSDWTQFFGVVGDFAEDFMVTRDDPPPQSREDLESQLRPEDTSSSNRTTQSIDTH